jgi:hypothetical protein
VRRAVLGLLVVVVAAAPADAAPWTVTAEGGAEVDSNVQRVETGPGLMTDPIAAGVTRLGLRLDRRGKLAGGSIVLGLSDLTRVVFDQSVAVENVSAFAGDVRWLHALGDRPVLAGVGATAADAFGLTDQIGARTFRNLGADGVLVVGTGDQHLTLTAGYRDFRYKPERAYDWHGGAASARLDLLLWQAPDKARSLELAGMLGVEARDYEVTALVDACPPGAPADPSCSMGTDIPRRDRYGRAGLEMTWVGRQLFALGYQVGVVDSNSYGQSLVRHRVSASGTMQLGKTYVTLLGILQIDQYPDGLLVQRDLQHTEFTNVEDENRSSLQLRLARKVSDAWSLEARAALWRNVLGANDLAFHRELGYLGLIYAK